MAETLPPGAPAMSAAVAESRPPSIGIFWFVVDTGRLPVLLADLCLVSAGEPYGDFLTHGGHYEHWTALAALGAGILRRRGLPTTPCWSEYEEWPRGRVIYHVPSGRFVLYADRQLQQPAAIGTIAHHFGLPANGFDVRSDFHYSDARKVRFP